MRDVTSMQKFILRIQWIILSCFNAQCFVKLELDNETDEISQVLDIGNYVILRSWIEVYFRSVFWSFQALNVFFQFPPGNYKLSFNLIFLHEE